MKKKLEGQVAIVTGGSSGIRAGVAKALAAEGAIVAINYSSGHDRAEAVLQEIKQAGGDGFTVQADVSQEADVLAMFQETYKRYGTVDILVNNSGLQKDAKFHEMTLDEWNRVIGINLTGQFLCAREATKRIHASRCGAGALAIGWQDHLHELRARGDTVGGACQLLCIERQRNDADEIDSAGICAAQDPRKQHRSRRYTHPYKPRSLANPTSL